MKANKELLSMMIKINRSGVSVSVQLTGAEGASRSLVLIAVVGSGPGLRGNSPTY